MQTFNDYRENAHQCIELSKRSYNTESRAVLLGMARAWMRLGEQVNELRNLNAHPGGYRRKPDHAASAYAPASYPSA